MRIRIFENIIKKVESLWKLALPAKCYGKRFERSKIPKIFYFSILCAFCAILRFLVPYPHLKVRGIQKNFRKCGRISHSIASAYGCLRTSC